MRIICAVSLLAAAFVGFAAPASGGVCEPGSGQADGRIKHIVEPQLGYVGNNEYSSAGANQSLSHFTPEGNPTPGLFKIRYENESAKTKTIRVDGTVLNTGDADQFTVQFVRNDRDVTAKVLDENLKFRNVPAGGLTKTLTLTVTPKETAQAPDDSALTLAGRYEEKPPCRADVVGANTELTA